MESNTFSFHAGDVKCYQPWQYFLVFLLIFLCVLPLYLLWKLHKVGQKSRQQRYAPLVVAYTEGAWYYEGMHFETAYLSAVFLVSVVLIYRRIIILLALLIPFQNLVHQQLVVVSLCVIGLSAAERCSNVDVSRKCSRKSSTFLPFVVFCRSYFNYSCQM